MIVIPAKAGIHSDNLLEKIRPSWVHFFNQFYFPSPAPLLDPFLAQNGILDVGKLFKPDQQVDAILLGEAFPQFITMFADTAS